jgi:uracil-DNA glycosylase family 4
MIVVVPPDASALGGFSFTPNRYCIMNIHKQLMPIVEKYKDCQNCHLSKIRNNVVFYGLRYEDLFDADPVVFIGEAPGQIENARGIPFLGPVGSLLQNMIGEVEQKMVTDINAVYLNAICCAPFKDDSKSRVRSATDNEIKKCSPILDEMLHALQPEKVVLLGKNAKKAFSKQAYRTTVTTCSLLHPGFIHRDEINQTLNRKQWVRQLHDYLTN